MSGQQARPVPTTMPITATDIAAGFACGEPGLDEFFVRHALGNHRRGIGSTFVLHDNNAQVLGYYTLSMADVDAKKVSRAIRGQLPRYPLPVALIGRLAVQQLAQGQRVGQHLLIDALRRVHLAANQVGCVGVIVDAKNATAEGFYQHYGFVIIDGVEWPHRLFLPMATLVAAVGP